jgi:hypothetical protein
MEKGVVRVELPVVPPFMFFMLFTVNASRFFLSGRVAPIVLLLYVSRREPGMTDRVGRLEDVVQRSVVAGWMPEEVAVGAGLLGGADLCGDVLLERHPRGECAVERLKVRTE